MEERALVRLLNLPDPRLAKLGIDRADVKYLAEEMIEAGFDPAEVLEEAYLKARDQLLSGRIDPEDLEAKVLEYNRQYRERDLAIGIDLLRS